MEQAGTIERLARMEMRLDHLDEKMDSQTELIGQTADDVIEIKILLAKEEGRQTALRYTAHIVSILMGGVTGFFGGKV